MARKPEYCTNSGVESCNECSMVNYRRDCHNNPIAKDDPNYSWLGNVKSDAADERGVIVQETINEYSK